MVDLNILVLESLLILLLVDLAETKSAGRIRIDHQQKT